MSNKKIHGGRENQKWRTRKEILRAAQRLLSHGGVPTLEEVAEEARVSRATIYRYFSNINLLLLEAPLDALTVEADDILADAPPTLCGKVETVQAYFHDLVANNEVFFRNYLRATLEQWMADGGAPRESLRQARRVMAYQEALAPVQKQLGRADYLRLVHALSVFTSIEAFVVLRDVCGLTEKEARDTGQWAVRHLTESVLAK
ncbi:MAG: TetR/AcrR family transcriptional regulator [Verrucomicrobia bacterium]|nr:TetR/AcrR family transcriptional regulator [Verrucomicrobiota bacterium]MCH8510542.1 TetR/AcrR family transcriptional regulator [Kiritimatiellia bacterium]